MKYSTFLLTAILALIVSLHPVQAFGQASIQKATEITDQRMMDDDKELRHVVLIKFKEDATDQEITKVQEAFSALPNKISEIDDYEWGTNNSPEGLNKGFTHCFLVTFENEKDRATYLPHPEHKAFVEIMDPHVEDVLVFDYWANDED